MMGDVEIDFRDDSRSIMMMCPVTLHIMFMHRHCFARSQLRVSNVCSLFMDGIGGRAQTNADDIVLCNGKPATLMGFVSFEP